MRNALLRIAALTVVSAAISYAQEQAPGNTIEVVEKQPVEDFSQYSESRIQEVMEVFQTRDRQIDPFGLSMNPAIAAKLELEAPEIAEESAPQIKTTLQEALGRLEITGVLPNRAIIVGPTQIRLGQEFNLEKDDITFRLKLTAVKLNEVSIHDLETGEAVRHATGIGPALSTGSAPRSPFTPMKRRPAVLSVR